eukprot:350933-Chlamydomonas_euryale.AAC.2
MAARCHVDYREAGSARGGLITVWLKRRFAGARRAGAAWRRARRPHCDGARHTRSSLGTSAAEPQPTPALHAVLVVISPPPPPPSRSPRPPRINARAACAATPSAGGHARTGGSAPPGPQLRRDGAAAAGPYRREHR